MERSLDVVSDATSHGIRAAVVVATVATFALALAVRHVFVEGAGLVPWLLTVWGWYVLGFALVALLVALTIAAARRLAPNDAARPAAAAAFAVVVVASLALHAALALNFYVLPSPINLDATRVIANVLLLIAIIAAFWLSLRSGARPRAARRAGAAVSVLVALAAIALARLLPAPPDAIFATQPPAPEAVIYAPAATTARVARRNVLLVTVDTLRADHLAVYGYGRDTSPSIDKLAAEGTLFDAAFVEKPITSPSFASLMTGTYIQRHGVHGASQVLAPRNLTLAEILHDAGFATSAVITNGNLFPVFGFNQGFETYDHQPNLGGRSRNADEVSDHAIDWLKRETKPPFFLWVHYVDPHDPYRPAPQYQPRYVGDRFYQRIPISAETCEPCAGSSPGFGEFAAEPESNLAWHVAQYDAEIRFVNDELARFLRAFDEAHRLDDTLLVFVADHGESFGELGMFGHGTSPHHSGAHVPLFFRLPGVIPKSKRITQPVSNVDIVPTILELAGVAVPPEVQGRSRADWILGDAPRAGEDGATLVEAGYGRHVRNGIQHALRTKRWCYVWRDTRWALRPSSPIDIVWIWNSLFEGGLAGDELYDLEKDPSETQNLIDSDAATAAGMRTRLLTELARRGPEGPGAKALDHAALKQADPGLEDQLRELGYVE